MASSSTGIDDPCGVWRVELENIGLALSASTHDIWAVDEKSAVYAYDCKGQVVGTSMLDYSKAHAIVRLDSGQHLVFLDRIDSSPFLREVFRFDSIDDAHPAWSLDGSMTTTMEAVAAAEELQWVIGEESASPGGPVLWRTANGTHLAQCHETLTTLEGTLARAIAVAPGSKAYVGIYDGSVASPTQIHLVDCGTATDCTCTSGLFFGGFPTSFRVTQLLPFDDGVIAAGFEGNSASIYRIDGAGNLVGSAVVDGQSGGSVFLAAATDGTSVFAAGFTHADPGDQDHLQSIGLFAVLPAAFGLDSAPSATVEVAGSTLVNQVQTADGGVYLTGQSNITTGVPEGFVARCLVDGTCAAR